MKQFLSFIFSRCLWLYLLATCLLVYYAQKGTPLSTRISLLNILRNAEYTITESLFLKKNIPAEECSVAIRYYEQLENLIGSKSYISGNKGFCYYYLGDYAKALAEYSRAIDMKPQIYTYYADKAAIYLKLRDYEQAIFWLMQAMSITPITIQYYKKMFSVLTPLSGSVDSKAYEADREALLQNFQQRTIQDFQQRTINDLSLLPEMLAYLNRQKEQKKHSQKALIPQDAEFLLHFDSFFGPILTHSEIIRIIAEQDK